MDQCTSKKRERDDSELSPDLPESKRTPDESEFNSSGATYYNSVVQDPYSELNSNRIRSDILDILDDDPENDSVSQDLDSVIKSFEEEILHPPQPELGYLLEASDDELGLPPAAAVYSLGEPNQNKATNLETIVPEVVGLGDMLGLEDGIASYDSFELGMGECGEVNDGNDEFVVLDGVFDCGETSEFSWRAESLPAL